LLVFLLVTPLAQSILALLTSAFESC
jgi:hypothetical protein